MLKQINPRVAMFEALEVSAQTLEHNAAQLRVFIDRKFSGPITILPASGESPLSAVFRYNG
jgi:hypothetical protein